MKKPMTPAARKAISIRMTKYWAARRRQKKAALVSVSTTTRKASGVGSPTKWPVDTEANTQRVYTETRVVTQEVPPWVLQLREEAKIEQQVRDVLLERALVDMKAVRAADLAYRSGAAGFTVIQTTPAEQRVLDEVVETLLATERSRLIELFTKLVAYHGTPANYPDEPAISMNLQHQILADVQQYAERIHGAIQRRQSDTQVLGQMVDDEFVALRSQGRPHVYPKQSSLSLAV